MKQKMVVIGIVIFFAVLLLLATISYQNLQGKYKEITESQNKEQENTETQQKYSKAKNFIIYNEQQEQKQLDDFAGKGTVINLWTTWCTYCKKEMPYFEKLYQEYQDDIHFVMVNVLDGGTESVENGIQYRNQQNYTFPIYFDKDFSLVYAYYVSGYPMTIFIDKDGNLVDIHYGMITEEQLRENIEKIK